MATDINRCNDVVLDGQASTCTDAGACTYTPANVDDFNMTSLGVVDLAYSFGVGAPRPAAATHLFFHSVNNKGSLKAAVNFSDCMVIIPEPEPEPEPEPPPVPEPEPEPYQCVDDNMAMIEAKGVDCDLIGSLGVCYDGTLVNATEQYCECTCPPLVVPEPEPQGGCLAENGINFDSTADYDDGTCNFCFEIGMGADCRLAGGGGRCQWDRDAYVCMDACSRSSCGTCRTELECDRVTCKWTDLGEAEFCATPCEDIGCFSCMDAAACSSAQAGADLDEEAAARLGLCGQ